MKPRLLIVAAIMLLACFMCSPVSAAVLTGTFGDKNSSGNYRMQIDNDGLLTFASDTGIKFPYQSGTTNDTLTAADSGRTYVVTSGAISAPTLQLPAAAVGMVYPIVSATTEQIAINPNGTDIINYASLSAGDAIINGGAKGDKITFYCVTANEWSVSVDVGTWVDANVWGD